MRWLPAGVVKIEYYNTSFPYNNKTVVLETVEENINFLYRLHRIVVIEEIYLFDILINKD